MSPHCGLLKAARSHCCIPTTALVSYIDNNKLLQPHRLGSRGLRWPRSGSYSSGGHEAGKAGIRLLAYSISRVCAFRAIGSIYINVAGTGVKGTEIGV